MKKLTLAVMMFLPILLFGQIDVQKFPGRQPYVELGRNLVWGSSGIGGANNYFIFAPINPDQRYCGFIVNNNSTSAHTYTLTAWQTGDPNQTVFANNASGRWIQDTVQGNNGTVAAGATTTFYVHANAGARFAISLTGATTQAGSPDTLDFFVVQTSGESCGPSQSGSPTFEKGGRWSLTSFPATGSAASSSRAAGVGSVKHIADCIVFSAMATVAPGAITGGAVVIRDGATGVGTIIFESTVVFPAATGQLIPPFGVCGLNLIGSPATAMTVEFSVAIANVNQAVFLSGYDVN